MKKLISAFLIIALTLTLCACGTVTIGPLDFHFDRSAGEHGISAGSNDIPADIAVADDAMEPAVEAPAMAGDTYEMSVGSVSIHQIVYGSFSDRGIPADLSTEGASPYLIVSFSYSSDYVSETYIDYLDIGGNIYPVAYPGFDGIPTDHFVNNIERYFGYDYAFGAVPLENGSAKAIACFAITEESMAMLEAGASPVISFNGELFESPYYANRLWTIDGILIGEQDFGYTYEGAHSGATLLWALDFTHNIINTMRMRLEERGDTGILEDEFDEICTMYLYDTFYGGIGYCPATTPDFNGQFEYGFAELPLIIEHAAEIYPDIAEMCYEYADICYKIADLWWNSGNFNELMELTYYADELYYVMMDMAGLSPLVY